MQNPGNYAEIALMAGSPDAKYAYTAVQTFFSLWNLLPDVTNDTTGSITEIDIRGGLCSAAFTARVSERFCAAGRTLREGAYISNPTASSRIAAVRFPHASAFWQSDWPALA